MAGKGGRPSKFNDEVLRQAKLLYLKGFTDAEVAEVLNVDETTINEWKKVHPEFSQSLKTAKEIADSEVEKSLYQRALGYSHPAVKIMQHEGCPLEVPYTEHYPPSEVACIFWLKNRQPDKWRDKHELVGKDDTPLIPVINFGKK